MTAEVQINPAAAAGATKLVQVHLAALTRVEYMEVVEVPADITAEELDDLVRRRYDKVDGGLYSDDPHYWEKGECFAQDADAADIHAVASVRAARVNGALTEEVTEAGQERFGGSI